MKHQKVAALLLSRVQDEPAIQALLINGRRRQAGRLIVRLLEALIREIGDLKENEELPLQGFGKFLWKVRGPRPHWNMVKECIEIIPEQVVLAFRPSKRLRRPLHEKR